MRISQGLRDFILTHSLEMVVMRCILCTQEVKVAKPEIPEEGLLLEGDCEGCGANIRVFDVEKLCPKCLGLAMHGPSQLVLDIQGILRILLDKGLVREEVDGGIPLGYTLGIVFTELLVRNLIVMGDSERERLFKEVMHMMYGEVEVRGFASVLRREAIIDEIKELLR